MKYIFFIATLLGIVCFFLSDTKSEMLAWATSTCFALTSALLVNENEKLKKDKGDEGR
jgi:hypothetical protein